MDYLDFFEIYDNMDDLDREHDLQSGVQRKVKRYKKRSDPFVLNESDFRTKYRFSKQYARKIIEIVRNDIEENTKGGAVPCELQVLTALRTWARNEIQDDAADLHGLSQQTVSNICERVSIALARRSRQYIKMPETIAQQQEVIAGFRSICGFRNVIGAIDGTHIRIKKVSGDASQYYVNRKGYYSLNVQVVCDSTLRIRDIVAHWRGSTHDSRIFRESRIKKRFEQAEFRGRLLGDSGYACTPYLFTPLLNPRNAKEENYNKAHIHTRNVVERCFGVWKQRFRCLLQGFRNSLEHTKTEIVALAVLHNIAIDMREEIIGEVTVPSDEPIVSEIHNNASQGQAMRAAFINQYF